MKAALLLLVASCGAGTAVSGPTDWSVAYAMPITDTALSLRSLDWTRSDTEQEFSTVPGMGDVGPIHPAVLEYVFAAPGSPIRRYFAAWLAEGGASDRAGAAQDLRRRAAALAPAHVAPGAIEYARAWTQLVRGQIEDVLAGQSRGEVSGAALIECCSTVDPLGPRLVHATGMRDELGMLLVRNQAARFVMLAWRDDLNGGTLTWDTSALPDAFDPSASLDYATVATALVPLHDEGEP